MPELARTIVAAIPLAATLACGGEGDEPASETKRMETRTVPAQSDAGAVDAAPAPSAASSSEVNFHLDTATKDIWKPERKPAVPPRTLRLTLRSAPPGATALIDGIAIGVTPTYWEGPATGKPRDFVFTLRGYAMARYRFVPTTHGTVHATLKKLVAAATDGGAQPSDEATPE
jgi:hypothetical protein